METSATHAPAATSGKLTIALGLIVAAVSLWFALESIYGNWYAIFRVVHVVLAVFWVGGGLTITVLGLRAERSDDPNDIAHLAGQAGFVGEKFFAPAGLLVFLAGIALTINGDIEWGQFWIVFGLLGYLSTFVTGMGFLSPTAKKIAELSATQGVEHPQTQALIRKILLVVRFDMAVLLLVVADMVLKPFA
jgi:uncharacterized membrane protein